MQSVKKNINDHIAVKSARFLMRLIGMWYVTNRRDELMAYLRVAFVILLMLSVAIVQSMDFFYCLGNLNELATTMPAIFVGLSECAKFAVFLINRNKIMAFNAYTDKLFWTVNYNNDDLTILEECNKFIMSICPIYLVIIYAISSQYLILPVIGNYNTNSTIRELPFALYFGVDWTKTPFYQMAYIEEIFACYAVAVCTMANAGYLFTINIYTAGQFKILQRQLRTLCDSDVSIIHLQLKDYIKKHQVLISYVAEIENLYCFVILFQVLSIVVILCFSGFGLMIQAGKDVQRSFLNILCLIGGVVQLLLFSLSCQFIMEESHALGDATYNASWYNISDSKYGRSICQSLTIMLMRSEKSCVITVGKFTPMTIATFTSVLKTAMSYFTVLRTISEN